MECFVARQPIFNDRDRIIAYELLFRSGFNNFFDFNDGDKATSNVLNNSFNLIGLETLTTGKKAFVNFTKNLIIKEIATLFHPSLICIEVLENIHPEKSIIKACKRLKYLGYTLILDDFNSQGDIHNNPLVKLSDIIKIDFRNTDTKYIQQLPIELSKYNIKLLAEKVETKEEFHKAKEWGYSYFQGYFFCKPEIHKGKDIPDYKINYIRLLQAIHKPQLEFDQLEEIIKHDFSIVYKLLRFINSSFFGLSTEIRSIKHALVLLGLDEIKKWLSFILLSNIAMDKPVEVIISSFIRAQFCEELALNSNHKENSSAFFLMGLFSMIDSVFNKPMNEVLSLLPLSKDIKSALLGQENYMRKILELVIAYERGEWPELSKYTYLLENIKETEIPNIYFHSIENASKIFKDSRFKLY